MEINVSRDDLTRLISAVGRVVESRNVIPVLSTVKLEFDGTELSATATDLDVVATAKCPASGKPGAICVEAKLLADIAKKASSDISIALKDDRVVVKSGRSRFTLNHLPVADFPDMKEATYDATFVIDLAAAFAPCMFAISTEETRYYLNGVFIHVDGANLRAVATDGHRLSLHQVDLPDGAADMPAVIVPRKVSGMLPKGEVTVSVGRSGIRIVAPSITLVSKLIDGTFPDYKRVVPQSGDKTATAHRDVLLRAAERVSVVSSEKGRAVRFGVTSGAIALSVNGADGEASDEVEVEYSGEPIEIGFNSRYVAEALGVFPPGDVAITMTDPGTPAVISSPGYAGLFVIIMPYRVS